LPHQEVLGELLHSFHNAIKENKQYKVFPWIDWKISETTVVNPDLLIMEGIVEKDFLDFPPLLIAEVLNDETETKDRNEKMELYRSQKVRYYLIADPTIKKLEVLELIEGEYQVTAINPESFLFGLNGAFSVAVDFIEIWD
jgi:Uma2 family endonuclease